MNKLSKVQREVLTYMAEGHTLYRHRGEGAPWLNGVLGQHALVQPVLPKRVHSNTLQALKDRGYIERADTEATPWYRRDYKITQEGREAISE